MNDEADNSTPTVPSAVSAISGEILSSENTGRISPANLSVKELELTLNKAEAEDELTETISRVKESIVENSGCSIAKKWLVRYLIELRLRLEEHKDAMADPRYPRTKTIAVSNRIIKGHHFVLQPLLKAATHPYCDHCTETIWSVFQAWYMCRDCEYACHYKCMTELVRECAHVVACEKGQYELKICPETSMEAEDYFCAECKTQLVPNEEWSDIRRCDYNGLYYCPACHWGSSAIIPARVIHVWDFEPYPVCQASLQLLKVTAERPIIQLEKLNPLLFVQIQELNLVKRLRQQLQGIKKYLSVCRIAVDDHLLWKCEKPYLMENVDMYSLQDLVDTQSGELPYKLHRLIDMYYKHIKKDCEICRGRGHICEVCKSKEVFFPFDPTAHVCAGCQAVFHKNCIEGETTGCPRCARIKMRAEKREEANNNHDS